MFLCFIVGDSSGFLVCGPVDRCVSHMCVRMYVYTYVCSGASVHVCTSIQVCVHVCVRTGY